MIERASRVSEIRGGIGRTLAVMALVAVPKIAVAAGAGSAARLPAAVLWLETPAPEWASAVEGALAASKVLRPIDDDEARRLCTEGGPASRVAARLASGRERFAALRDLDQADAQLAAAEEIALREMTRAEACPQLVEVERLRLRYAELVHAEPAAAMAALLLAACMPSPLADDAAAIARHPPPAAITLPPLRIESEPAGADVLVDLTSVGKTPFDLPVARRSGAFVDLELGGYRKVHRALADGGEHGTLAISLARDSEVGVRVDKLRAAAGNGAEADFAELARRLGVSRLVVLHLDGAAPSAKLQARVLDVATSAWTLPPTSYPAPADGAAIAMTSGQIATLAAAPPEPIHGGPHTQAGRIASLTAPGAVVPPPLPSAPADGGTPAWKKWYTWVVGGALVALVGGFVIASHVGDNEVEVHVTH